MKRSILSLLHFAREQLPHVLNNKEVEGTQGNRKERNDVGINQQPGIWTKRRHHCPLPAKTAPLCITRLPIAPSGIVKRHHIKQVVRGRRERRRGSKPGKTARRGDATGIQLNGGRNPSSCPSLPAAVRIRCGPSSLRALLVACRAGPSSPCGGHRAPLRSVAACSPFR